MSYFMQWKIKKTTCKSYTNYFKWEKQGILFLNKKMTTIPVVGIQQVYPFVLSGVVRVFLDLRGLRAKYVPYHQWREDGVSVKICKKRKDSSLARENDGVCANCVMMPLCFRDNPDAWKISSNNTHFFWGSSSKVCWNGWDLVRSVLDKCWTAFSILW